MALPQDMWALKTDKYEFDFLFLVDLFCFSGEKQ